MINGSIINSYYVCKRKTWLIVHRINLESNSDDVAIGKALHENFEAKSKEILIDHIKVDQVTNKYIVELKKNETFIDAAIAQLKYYMYILNQKGLKKDGKVKILETGYEIKLEFNDDLIIDVENMITEIENFLQNKNPIEFKIKPFCRQCAYYHYCLL